MNISTDIFDFILILPFAVRIKEDLEPEYQKLIVAEFSTGCKQVETCFGTANTASLQSLLDTSLGHLTSLHLIDPETHLLPEFCGLRDPQLSRTIQSAADCEQGWKMRSIDIVKMDKYNTQIVIQAMAFAVVTGNSLFPATKLWNKHKKEHIVMEINGESFSVDLKSAWHHDILVIVQIVKSKLTDTVNSKLFGFSNYLELENGIRNRDKVKNAWLPQESIYLPKLSKLHSNYTNNGLKTTIKSHYAKPAKVWAHVFFLLQTWYQRFTVYSDKQMKDIVVDGKKMLESVYFTTLKAPTTVQSECLSLDGTRQSI